MSDKLSDFVDTLSGIQKKGCKGYKYATFLGLKMIN